MQITDKVMTDHMSDKTFTLEVEAGNTIGAVKAKIQEQETGNVLQGPRLQLIFKDQEGTPQKLEDGHTLQDYGIQNEPTLILLEQCRGGLP